MNTSKRFVPDNHLGVPSAEIAQFWCEGDFGERGEIFVRGVYAELVAISLPGVAYRTGYALRVRYDFDSNCAHDTLNATVPQDEDFFVFDDWLSAKRALREIFNWQMSLYDTCPAV